MRRSLIYGVKWPSRAPISHNGRFCGASRYNQWVFSCQSRHSLPLRRHINTSLPQHEQSSHRSIGNQEPENTQKAPARKSLKIPVAKTSLRRVALEAERSRGGLRSGQRGHPDGAAAGTKEVTAYCTAEQYDIVKVGKLLKQGGYSLDPLRTELYPQVIHFRTSPDQRSREDMESSGDVFVFPSGTVVAWNVAEQAMLNLISTKLTPAAQNPHPDRMESEDLEYIEDTSSEKSSIVGETIRLGVKSSPAEPLPDGVSKAHAAEATTAPHPPTDSTNTVLSKIAFSSGLARSAKLAMLETSLDSYFRSTRSIPTLLSAGSRIPFTRSFILRKTGQLLSLRAQLNLYSELTDRLPDLFWDSRHELGLEGYFDQVGRALDVGVRIRVLNERMNYAQEMATVLRERLSEQHGLMLEWLIVILISIEVAFEILRLWRDRRERQDPHGTEAIVRRYLEKALQEQGKPG